MENQKIKMTLEAARVNAGFTQEQVASMIGVRKETVSNWEKDIKKIKLGSFLQLCKIYNVDVNNIFFNN